MSSNTRGLTLLNATMAGGERFCLRIVGSRIAQLDGRSPSNDIQIDLRGDCILPGLINAHDHLHLNNFPRLKYREHYSSATDWIGDIRPRLNSDPALTIPQSVPRDDRLLLGGIKNLLSGVTTVGHHDPLYPSLVQERFPTRLVTRYGWAHSLLIDGDEVVRRSHRLTPPHWPWIIHAAEGIDAEAAEEFERLDLLGCIGANTLIVHGVALNCGQRRRLAGVGAGMIWCPSSNMHLFHRTAEVQDLLAHGRVALGSDSRLSGGQDLLAELQLAHELSALDERGLESLVTADAARLLRLTDRGKLQPGALADLLVLPAGLPLARANRADIRLVMRGGAPLYADPDYAESFGGAAALAPVCVDGRPKYLARSLVSQLSHASVKEPGLELNPTSARPASPLSTVAKKSRSSPIPGSALFQEPPAAGLATETTP